MPLADVLAKIRADIAAGNTPDIETLLSDVEREHDEDMSIRDAAVSNATNALADKDKTITDLKLKNYDLITKVPGQKTEKPEDKQEKTDPDENVDITVDDLFGE